MVRWNTPFNKVQTPSQFFAWHLLWKERRHVFKIMMSVLFRCFIHMEGYIAHIQPWPVSFKEYYIHPRVLLHSNAFLCITAWISIKWRLFTYLHQHFLWGIPWSLSKMSTQRIPFSRNTTPSIFQKCVTLLNEILQKVMLHFYTSFRIQRTASI